jgi:hypothetical protein
VLKGRLILEVMGHHWRWRRARLAWSVINLLIFVVVVPVLLAHEVLGALVFVRAAILLEMLDFSLTVANMAKPAAAGMLDSTAPCLSIDLTYILIPPNRLVDISRREFIELLVVAEYNDGDIHGAEDG